MTSKSQSRTRGRRRHTQGEALEARHLLAGDLIAQWTADDLNDVVDAGAVVQDWSDSIGNISARNLGTNPTLIRGGFGGRSGVRFDTGDGADLLQVGLTDNPVNGLDEFTVVVAFSTTSSDLQGDGVPWYESTGLVDANALVFGKGWGISLTESAQVAAGTSGGFGGAPAVSAISNAADLNNGNVHVAVFTSSSGMNSIQVDGLDVIDVQGADTTPRTPVTLTFGSLNSTGGDFTGEIGQVRIYNGKLSPQESMSVSSELQSYYSNTRPTALPDSYTLNEDPLIFAQNAAQGVLQNDVDADGDSLMAVLVTPPSNGELLLRSDGSFVYDPAPDFAGTDSFTYSAFDFRESDPVTVTLIVNPVDDPTVANDDNYKMATGTVLSVTADDGLLANDIDVDNDPLNTQIVANVTNGTLNLTPDGSFTYDPQGFFGVETFTYKVSDGVGTSNTSTVTIVINSAPTSVADQFTIAEDSVLTRDAATGVLSNDTDFEGNAISATLFDGPSHGELTFESDGSFSYTPNRDYFGADSFRYTISDGIDDNTQPITVSLKIEAVNDAPVGVPDFVVTFLNESRTLGRESGVLANDSDVDSPGLTAVIARGAENGQVVLNADGSLTYTPNADYLGADSFAYSVTDGDATTGPVEVSVVVAPLDQQIVINEVHYDPPDNTVPEEFIELYNQGTTAIDVSNWFFGDGVLYVIPEGTVVQPGEFLVVAQDPEAIRGSFSVPSIGPWQGRLSSEGELIVLRNAAGEQIDRVDYRQGFPWPIAAGGDGPSMELINSALDNDLGGSWRSGSAPTPGAVNSVFAPNAAPQIRQVNHSPEQPTSSQPTTITAKVTDPNGVASVSLQYQVVAAGEFIPVELPVPVADLRRRGGESIPREANPEYENPARWTNVTMVDDGTNGDEAAGDSIYTAVIPPQAHRTLMRYRIDVTDTIGESVRVPYADDASRNFAYFVYDGVPEYNGHSVEALNSLPVYHLIARAEDVTSVMAYSSRDQLVQGTQVRFSYNWPAAFVYNGKVYDNINFRLRGANGRYHLAGKRSMRFRFNDGSYMQAHDQDGNPFPFKWRTLTTGKMFDNRQTMTYSLNESINMYLYNQMGLPAPNTLYSHFRVIDSVEETDRYKGDFWGFSFVTETYDVRFLDTHEMERGNLYKLINQTRDPEQQQRYQAPNAVTDGSDHDNIERNLTGRSTAEYIDAHVNLEKYYTYHALTEATRNYDYWPDANKNMAYYFEPVYTPENNNLGKLWILPWDQDASWGPTWNSGHDVVYNSIFPASGGGADSSSTPELWPEYYNHIRELRDLLWQPDQIEPLIQQFADVLRPMEQADRDRWTGGEREDGTFRGITGPGTESIDALVQDMMNFAFSGGNWPGGSVPQGGRARHLDNLQGARGEGDEIPATPSIFYIGQAAFPQNGLAFQTTPFSDPQGNDSFGKIEWRIAEITDPNAPAFDPNEKHKLEWTSSWESGELTEFTAQIEAPSTAVEPGRTYRARVRMQDNTGRWSHWSEPVQFTATAATGSDLIDSLRVSEIQYHPADPTQSDIVAGFNDADDFEFIELVIISNRTIDISVAKFENTDIDGDNQGIAYEFSGSAIKQLAPGERVLVVEDTAAFAHRFGDGLPVAGQYSGALSNGGEQLTLSADGFIIQQFTYDDAWHPSTDGDGNSLQIRSENGSLDLWSQKDGWTASVTAGGSPGTTDGPIPGDSNHDGVFNSSDFVLVFQAGEYEDGIEGNSTFEEGDWDGDGDFTTGDFVFAFTAGTYIAAARGVPSKQVAATRITEQSQEPVRRDALRVIPNHELESEGQVHFLPDGHTVDHVFSAIQPYDRSIRNDADFELDIDGEFDERMQQ
ncbi:MAG: tandem-95 repeat protein [Planctomycetales bacterium]|nr:tandem-95 repeat protein [Planctomycetales bacterium]